MPVELINPEGLPTPGNYAQIGLATGTRTAYISGQVARDADDNTVGTGDLAAQVEQALTNLNIAVTAVGGTFADIAKVTVYVVDWTPDKMDAINAGALRAAERLGIDPVRPATLVGVPALAEPDLLVEIEAVAVLA
ncbi:RidA family protein [Virgisporangium aurantiacum]|uniref:Enamine deaminase RidA n=1 Tax=Virgisporangium aurantiacum TaxID=175570 RepID=A0A8J4E2R3_9ACTN|nr:RidA family protein [Virgisporangium aurantiacum]GIJ59158.1 enamine deaminase RidA [Virgisporangium aurantiacum]